jgi:NAD(P)-dependent dehydrogenase (short-subunit alcohol dehydrogenase family)
MMSLYQLFKANGPNGFGYGTTAEQVTEGMSLAGRTMLVTGCNSGLGLETMRVLALRGARIVGTARTIGKAREACATVTAETVPLACELSKPANVRECVASVEAAGIRLDAMICNAGIMGLPKLERVLGYESQFFTNHIGHFILVTWLLGQLTETGRVVVLSSTAHTRAKAGGIEFDNLDGGKGYDPWRFYGQSKFANLLFAKELARRLAGTRRTANAVHPGVIRTNLIRHNPVLNMAAAVFSPLFLKTVAQGAATQVYVATNPGLANVSGEYFADCDVATPRADALSAANAQRLWEVSEQIVAKLP